MCFPVRSFGSVRKLSTLTQRWLFAWLLVLSSGCGARGPAVFLDGEKRDSDPWSKTCPSTSVPASGCIKDVGVLDSEIQCAKNASEQSREQSLQDALVRRGMTILDRPLTPHHGPNSVLVESRPACDLDRCAQTRIASLGKGRLVVIRLVPTEWTRVYRECWVGCAHTCGGVQEPRHDLYLELLPGESLNQTIDVEFPALVVESVPLKPSSDCPPPQ